MARKSEQSLNITISSKTIAKFLIVGALLWFLYMIRDIVAILFVALIVASAFAPWVNLLEKRGIPRGIGIISIYVGMLGVVGLVFFLLIPALAAQVHQLSVTFPEYVDRIVGLLQNFQSDTGFNIIDPIKQGLHALQSMVVQFASGVFVKLFDIIGGLAAFFLIFVVTFYMTVEEGVMRRALKLVIPIQYRAYTNTIIEHIQFKIGMWLRAQAILSMIIFLLSFVGLSVLGVDYALVLALVAGLTEFMPVIGPIIGAVPAIFIAFNTSPWLALWVLLLYLVIQRVENDLLVPKVMQKAVGINPLVSIIAILIGGKIAGFFGVLLAIPVTTAISVIVSGFLGPEEDDDEAGSL